MPKKEFKKNRKPQTREVPEYEQKIIDLARVTRVMAGGKRMRFRACVAIGDKKGKVGIGIAKGADVTIAVNKAVNRARKNLIKIPIVNETIPHEIRIKYKAAKLMLKPAPKGTGVKAGGAVRVVLELGGVPNIVGKILGTNNKVNNVKALVQALDSFKIKPKNEKLEAINKPAFKKNDKKGEKKLISKGEPNEKKSK